MLIEIACNSFQSALNAQAGGAARIELCADLEIGGTTPSFGTIQLVKNELSIPIHVLIRPRGGDFIYSEYEFRTMLADIALCKELGIEGIAVGVLDANANIDLARMEQICEEARPMSITFNRAFDLAGDYKQALNQIIDLKIDRILTSGMHATAIEGRHIIKQLVNWSNGRVIIMPGSGVNENNLMPLFEFTGAEEFHSSARRLIKSNMPHLHRDLKITTNDDLSENDYYVSDTNRIKKLVNVLNTTIID